MKVVGARIPRYDGIAHVTGRTIEAHGGTQLNQVRMDEAHYEVKYQGPDGIVVDLGHWAGTAPIDEARTARGATQARVTIGVPSGEVDE